MLALQMLATVAQAESAEPESLQEVKVVSKKSNPNASEVSKSYTVESTTSATRLDSSIRETPQSISVITRELLDDFRVLTVNEALAYATGVRVEQFETDRSTYSARGFDITNFQIDGLSTPIIYGTQYGDLDVALYDRIEVLRGANGLLTATGNPSATINFIRKRPTDTFKATVSGSMGSWDNRRVDADVAGPLNENGNLRGRLVLVHQDRNSYLDRYSTQRNVAYGVIEADISDNTLLTVGHTYHANNTDGNMWGSLPLLYSDGSKRHYKRSDSTAPDWSYWDAETNITFAELKHQLANGWEFKTQLTHKTFDSDARLHYIFGNEDRNTGTGLMSYPGRYRTYTRDNVVDVYLNGPFDVAGRTHQMVVGTTWSKASAQDYARFGTAIGAPLASFDSAADFPLPDYGPENKTADFSTRTLNTYVAARLNPTDLWKVTLGGSLLSYDMEGISYGVDQNTGADNKLIPYVGTVYDLNDTHSLYASYTGIYKPQAELGADFKVLAPLKGKNIETGLKSEWLDGRLNSTFSVFKAEQENVPLALPSVGTTFYRGIEVNSKGYELDIAGELTDRLHVNAGYTRLMSLKGANDENVNTYTPRHQAHLAAVYKVPQIENLKLGASLNWQSDTYVNIGTVRYTQNSYAVLNLMANYQINPHWNAAINVYNVTDQKYISSLRYAYAGQAYYAAPVNALATLTWKF